MSLSYDIGLRPVAERCHFSVEVVVEGTKEADEVACVRVQLETPYSENPFQLRAQLDQSIEQKHEVFTTHAC